MCTYYQSSTDNQFPVQATSYNLLSTREPVGGFLLYLNQIKIHPYAFKMANLSFCDCLKCPQKEQLLFLTLHSFLNYIARSIFPFSFSSTLASLGSATSIITYYYLFALKPCSFDSEPSASHELRAVISLLIAAGK